MKYKIQPEEEDEEALRCFRNEDRRNKRFIKKWNLKEGCQYWILVKGGSKPYLNIGTWSAVGSMTQSCCSFAVGFERDTFPTQVLRVVKRIPVPKGYNKYT